MTATYPQWLQEILADPPQRSGGLNNWLFMVAGKLRYVHKSAEPIVAELYAIAAAHGLQVRPNEIERQVSCAVQVPLPDRGGKRPGFTAPPKWPAVNAEQVEAITGTGFKVADLREQSRIQFTGSNPKTEGIIDHLFQGRNVLLCGGWSNREFDTQTREEWRGRLSGLQFVVPSAMSAREGLTKEGKLSPHALANTGPRWFQVVEFDSGPTDQHAALLWHLAHRAPLALAVHSGGKSLHGWFHCKDVPEDDVHRFMRYAVSLGADDATWRRSQFVRIPDGQRETGERQRVEFINPEVCR